MNLKEILKKFNQTHLLQFEQELTKEEKQEFYQKLTTIPYQKMHNLYNDLNKEIIIDKEKLTAIKYFDKQKIDKDKLKEIGLSYINNYALITLAGGSGTRLGHHGPKGTYELKINNQKISIFGIIAKHLKEINIKYNIYIPWYILTNELNDAETKEYFIKNKYFDYPKEKITFFRQKNLPILDTNGNMLLKDKNHLLEAGSGNGEVFNALKENKILDKLKKQNIKYVQISNIDNILCKVFDPIFIGLMQSNNLLVGAKTLEKENENDKEYVFCKYKNKPYLLPYLNVKNKNVKENESFKETFTGISLFDIEALEIIQEKNLPYHKAFKAYSYIDKNGKQISNDKPNTFKFEKFIFESFYYFNDILLYRVDKETEFAPIKNKTGENSKETAIKQYEQAHKSS